ncbi:DMT family transporter [Raineyella fluvialis]|uniref:EamA family transporter n=1 Tax=Raineyella fluvialis TaxID=2662261 RepID=A0A5Q2FAR0_9ACTN|nr:DMT family transporter [Raineyella fluvialis]QGF22454.1 EamA family transporter [Raineyella fluvialis]
MKAAASSRRTRANLLLLLAAAIWGFAFVAQIAGAHVGAFTFNSSRFLLGALSLLPVIGWLDRRDHLDTAERRRRWVAVVWPGLLIGVLLFAGSSLQQIGLQFTTAGHAAFVTALYVVTVPLVGVLLGHRIRGAIWVGAGLAVAGLYLLTMTGGPGAMNTGDVLCLASTFFWTGHILAVSRFSRRVDPLRLSVAQFVANSAYAAVTALLVEPHPFTGLSTVLGPIAYAGLVSVGVAYTLQVVGQRDALPSHAALIMSLETVFGALGGALFLGERMVPMGYLGAALMLAGIIVSQLPARRPPLLESDEVVPETAGPLEARRHEARWEETVPDGAPTR